MKGLYLKPNEVSVDIIESDLTKEKNVSLSILRLDKIHPVISGNKLFKLHYFLEDANNSSHKKIITFGGAYSNHLAAAAFAGRQCGLQTIGIIRGEKPKELSHTLQFCQQQGMYLEFITKAEYASKEKESFLMSINKKFGEHTLIPEGGFGQHGVRGAAIISDYFKDEDYTHVCCSVGTATTLAGIVSSASIAQQIIGFSALKNIDDLKIRMQHLSFDHKTNYNIAGDYHFGGYAKKTDELISFMNIFFESHHVPLDFVYTAKMMFGVNDLIRKNYFLPNSKILCIHTGGLQGNLSLPMGMLNF